MQKTIQPTQESFDLYDCIYYPYWHSTSFKVVIGIFLFILIVLCLYAIHRFIRYRGDIRMAMSPWVVALEQINKLNASSASTKDDFKKIYFDLTRVLRWYVGMRYGWQVADKTDQELIGFLKDKSWNDDLIKSTQALLDGVLMVRFANESALKDQVDHHIEILREIIKKTIPIDSQKQNA